VHFCIAEPGPDPLLPPASKLVVEKCQAGQAWREC